MFKNLFGKKAKPETVFAFVKVNAKLMPMERGALFEDPLAEELEAAKLGAVTGAGSGMTESGEVAYCGIDVEMVDTERTPAFICEALNRRGAPKGSEVQYRIGERQVVVPFGVSEGIAVYIGDVDLPDDQLEGCSMDTVIETINTLLSDPSIAPAAILGTWEGPEESALYMYGPSGAKMRAAIAPFLAEYPLCRNSRVVEIT